MLSVIKECKMETIYNYFYHKKMIILKYYLSIWDKND